MADHWLKGKELPVRTAAWYKKEEPSFADVTALVRSCLWWSCHFATSKKREKEIKVSRSLLERLTDAACYAA